MDYFICIYLDYYNCSRSFVYQLKYFQYQIHRLLYEPDSRRLIIILGGDPQLIDFGWATCAGIVSCAHIYVWSKTLSDKIKTYQMYNSRVTTITDFYSWLNIAVLIFEGNTNAFMKVLMKLFESRIRNV